jgi:hypothetical protein
MAYAFESAFPSANGGASGRTLPEITPALTFDADALPVPVETVEQLPEPEQPEQPTTPDVITNTVYVPQIITNTVTVPSGEKATPASFTITGTKVKSTKSGAKFTVTDGCASPDVSCTGTVRARTATGASLGVKKIAVKAGHTKRVTFATKGHTKRALRKHKATTVRISTSGTKSTVSVKAVRVTVRNPR